MLLGVIASKHGIGILDALTQGATGTPESQLRHSKRKENYPGNLAIPMAALRLAVERGLEMQEALAEAIATREFRDIWTAGPSPRRKA